MNIYSKQLLPVHGYTLTFLKMLTSVQGKKRLRSHLYAVKIRGLFQPAISIQVAVLNEIVNYLHAGIVR